MPQFTHLHVHSHYSMLDGMSKIPDLIKKAKKNGMYAMALTDHGNMFGIKDFLDTANKENGKVKDRIKELEAQIAEVEKSYGDTVVPEGTPRLSELREELERTKGQLFKPIVGTEAYCARRTLYDKDKNFKELNPENGRERIVDSSGYHLILLAKNLKGYHSLCKLASIAYTDGLYTRPRIDHNVLKQYHEGLIVCSACLGGEIPQLIMAGKLDEAERQVLWFKEVFGDDYYIELMRHKTDKPNANTDTYRWQMKVEPELIRLARKHNIKIIATNDAHFVEEEHGEAHDHLICLATQKDYDDPNRLHYTKQEWLKSPEEMEAAFPDLPEALENTMEVASKVEVYSIDSDPLMPVFPIPESFGNEEQWREKYTEEDLFNEFTRNEKGEVVMSQEAAEKKIKKLGGYNKLYRIKFEADYLEHLVWEGARKRYSLNPTPSTNGEMSDYRGEDLSDEVRERIIFELHTIKTMGFPGYFLIVSDYIRAAREELGVSVGPGRGSAAGSVVAYCLWITDLDPLRYDLLFERFLNPDRISLPDIDVDFDDAGRGKVLEWVTHKYGKERVAHIITYGTMATKSSIADVGRVEKIPLNTVNQLKGYIPDRGFPDNIKDDKGKPPKVNLKNCYKYVPELKSIMENGPDDLKQMLTYAEELEDTNRQIGIHACGVIIGSQDITNVAPVCVINDKESGEDVLVTQYDGHVVENVGLIKMDFLGLKNLTIIKNCVRMVKKRTGEDIDVDHLPLDDELTYKLFCEGNTVGVFQFESAGMQKYLRELQPHVIDDLIAMNALYRPGPMDNIPEFIDRKQGRKPIEYDLPVMEKYLKDTYGITVYQEQVMLLSRLLAGFTRGQSDTLRKAMGKKQIDKMNELEVLFYEGGEKNGHPKEILSKIWEEWKKFASYAFNKSHAACYSWVAYQTAYLKAHYPAEYMAAVMTSAQTDISRVRELMDDCKKQGVEVAAPSVNDSEMDFSVDRDGKIRFGMQAISGMGEAASTAIIAEREKNGPYKDIFDFLKRVDMHAVNKKNMEVLVKAGAFDGVGDMHRAQYFFKENDLETTPTYLDLLVRWAIRRQDGASSNQMSIFSMSEDLAEEDHPPVPQAQAWNNIERCRHEKEVISTYLSGHPLDDFKYEMATMTNIGVDQLNHLETLVGKEVRFGGLVSGVKEMLSRKGEQFGNMTIDDYSGSYELRLFGDEYLSFKSFFTNDTFVYCRAKVNSRQYKDKNGNERTYTGLKVMTMLYLGGVLDKFSTNLTFKIRLDDVDEAFCKTIEKLAKKHKGKVPLRAIIVDPHQNLSLTMTSRDLHVNVHDAIPLLEQVKGVYDIKPEVRL
ncbi:MAG: DNA polymerase III subunit alpha [Bacteroidales bacterium]|nr:DNA polymerase III subunit alpha [Bacteroidales bacterium]